MMDSESELKSLITQLLFLPDTVNWNWFWLMDSRVISLITQTISLISSMDLDSLPKPESEFMSLIAQTISLFYSLDLDSQPKPLQELISLISQEISLRNSIGLEQKLDSEPMPKPKPDVISLIARKVFPECFTDLDSNRKLERDIVKLFEEILALTPELELMSLINKIFSLIVSTNSKSGKFISLCPGLRVELNGKFHVRVGPWSICDKWWCLPGNWQKFRLTGEDAIYFHCGSCNGKNHEEYKKAPVEIKHHLHGKHSLHLVLLYDINKTRKCYCCDDDLKSTFYCCLPCDFAMNMACVKKPPVLSIDHPKWHEHTLALFPRHASLTCNLCGLADSTSCPFYMCPPCDFVVHLRCINLPRVIRISRHHHRISFTPSFDQGVLSCGVCRKNIDNDYGGYSCTKDGCSYAAHSRCATQINVWDGKELEGAPEEDIEDVEPFVRISEGIIQHFSHQHHHLILDDNTDRDYDENKECQACITPIYFGNFYSCMQCDCIIHVECANMSRKIHHPIHPHQLTLGYENVVDHKIFCAACPLLCISGFFYECSKQGCDFKLHVQCATICEPLVHESHMHPLFLTSIPGEERRICSVCQETQYVRTNETFNCIECNFALCFRCATLPQKVRYKHDKHILSLYYGNETSTVMYWCEVCEEKINPKKRFYTCDEYCCATLHIECLLGRDLYKKPGSSWYEVGTKVHVLPNNHHMSRPVCSFCEKRCPHKIVLLFFGSIFCCSVCALDSWKKKFR